MHEGFRSNTKEIPSEQPDDKENAGLSGKSNETLSARWREFLEGSFIKDKQEIRRFVLWILNNSPYYWKLEIKNMDKEDVAEDILQNTYLTLLREDPKTQEKYFSLNSEQQHMYIMRNVHWAAARYFTYPVAGPVGAGYDYPHTKDVYVNPKAKLIELDKLEKRNIEGAENFDEPWPYGKARIKLSAPENNPYIQVEERIRKEQLQRMIDEMFGTLDERQEKILRMRFGLPPYDTENTLDEVAHALGVTRERVRQIETKALRRVSNPIRNEKLRPFWEEGRRDTQTPPRREMRERPKHYYRFYIYNDVESESKTYILSEDRAIRAAQAALNELSAENRRDLFMSAVVQEVDDSEQNEESGTQKFRNVWHGDLENVQGEKIETAWTESYQSKSKEFLNRMLKEHKTKRPSGKE